MSTRQSRSNSSCSGNRPCTSGSERSSTAFVQRASTRPQMPPPIASNRLSVSSCCSTRCRLAPNARRSANSRCLTAPRTNNRLPTFTQAMRRTSATTTVRKVATTWARRRLPTLAMPRTWSATIGATASDGEVRSVASCASIVLSSDDACAGVASSANRPKSISVRAVLSSCSATSDGRVPIGTQMSVRSGEKVPLNSRGATPAIEYDCDSERIVRPSTLGSRLN